MTQSTPLSAFIGSFMAPKHASETAAVAHLTKLQEGAQWRLDDDAVAQRPKGYHSKPLYTASEGFPEVPRRYTVVTHARDRNLDTYAANSYTAAIAIQEGIKTRGF
ncbi:hypothetical protein Poli38472_002592 [Pythium oligandrum]|uniref:Uncharacterized protein n=1 Tax=Pythium oligandrum TaxID=41045 RepID=A0A8K1CHH5_PYTOL|nr:hypothetical protein Poli38472_002592 [Pythium oligandrum]|eukprot:TMW63651.1 hypothetical protein Poli38472_002592 [Pythium oligandrum]